MKKISDYNCSYCKHTLKTYDLVRTHRIFSKKSHLSRKITLRKIVYDNEFIYKYNGIKSYIGKISDCLNQYNRRKRITVEGVINYRAFSVEVMYSPKGEEEGNYFDDEE